jgi:putative CocE/NonD family hydrolase
MSAVFCRTAAVVALAATIHHGVASPAAAQEAARVSRFNEYRGFTEPRHQRANRISVYVPMRDGVRRAVDVYRPLESGRPAAGKLPVVYLSQRYVRAWKNPDGTIDSPVARVQRDGTFTIGDGEGTGLYSWYLRFGYAVVIADMRGAGASFGPEIEFNSLEAGRDEYDVIEWIAAQPWSSGKIGMLGISYGAESQLMAAASRPPHLTALVAAAPEFDRFHGEAFVMGGVSRTGWTAQWLQQTQGSNAVTAAPPPAQAAPTRSRTIAPVDADRSGRLLAQAIEERRQANAKGQGLTREFEVIADIALGKLYWDEVPYASTFQNTGPNHLANSLARIDSAGIPTYFVSGWFDSYTNGATRYYNNLTMPRRLTLGPWPHGPTGFPNGLADPRAREYITTLTVDGLRWFDHWLRGVDNGIEREPPVSYGVMERMDRWSWRHEIGWPPRATRTSLFFAAGPSGSVRSVNDGLLTENRGALERGGADRWTVDYTSTTGQTNRFMAASGSKLDYGDLAPNDAKGLTYTTAPLEAEVTVAGHPVVTLYATSTATDGDFIAYLEEVDPSGRSEYLSEGMLRASFRVLADTTPYRYGGLPLPDGRRKVVEATPPLSAGVAELTFELYPTANRFERGNRIRVTVVGIDRGNTQTPVLDPAPTVTLFRSARYPSRIELPILARSGSPP